MHQLNDEQRGKLLTLVELEEKLDEYRNDDVGPYFHEDGRPWRQGSERGSSGAAPAHHPRRCRSTGHVTGRRCKRWALLGRNFCQFHGGGLSLRARNVVMPVGYSKHLMPSLAQRLQDFLTGGDYQEQLRLYEEIALARTMLTKDIELMNACSVAKDQGDARMTPELMMLTVNAVRRGTEHVADLCSKMAGIEKTMADRVGVQQLGFFVDQLTRVIFQRLGPENEELAKQLAQDLQDKVKLPADPTFDPKVTVEVTYD